MGLVPGGDSRRLVWGVGGRRDAVTRWRILALALGEKAHPDPRIADRVALMRLCIVAGVIRHWNR